MKQTPHAPAQAAATTPSTPTMLTAGLNPIPANPGPRLTLSKRIRAKCLDCCGGVRPEIAKCTTRRCPLWPVRLGKDPNRAPRTKQQQRAAQKSGQRLAALNRDKNATSPASHPGTKAGRGSLQRPAIT
jgi:hypothetical protein